MEPDLNSKEYCVLHIEDNLGDILLLKESLENHSISFCLKYISDGQEALENIFSESFNEPDLFIIDINLPRVDGKTILSRLKQCDKFKNIPVIIFSSSSAESDIQSSYDLGADLYLVKPMNWENYKEIANSIAELVT